MENTTCFDTALEQVHHKNLIEYMFDDIEFGDTFSIKNKYMRIYIVCSFPLPEKNAVSCNRMKDYLISSMFSNSPHVDFLRIRYVNNKYYEISWSSTINYIKVVEILLAMA